MKSEPRTLLVCGAGASDIADAVSASAVEGIVGVCLLQDMDAEASSLSDLRLSLPSRTVIKPKERYLSTEAMRTIRAQEKSAESTAIPALLKQLSAFAAKQRANDLWFVLDCQTSVRLAHLAMSTGKRTVRVEVRRRPSEWLKERNVDERTAKELLAKHDELVARAENVAVGSWALADDQKTRFGREPQVILPWLEGDTTLPPARQPGAESLRVGVTGLSYSSPEFYSLVEAMIGLKGDGEWSSVELHAFVDAVSVPATREGSSIHIRQIGTAESLIEDLSKLDLLFLCSPFTEQSDGDERQILARLGLYLASGRPILFHGRSDSAVARLLRSTSASYFCFREGAEGVRSALIRSVRQTQLYAEIASEGHRLLENRFSIEAHAESVRRFVRGVPKAARDGPRDASMRTAKARLEPAS